MRDILSCACMIWLRSETGRIYFIGFAGSAKTWAEIRSNANRI